MKGEMALYFCLGVFLMLASCVVYIKALVSLTEPYQRVLATAFLIFMCGVSIYLMVNGAAIFQQTKKYPPSSLDEDLII